MNKWFKYGVTGLALAATQASVSEVVMSALSTQATVNVDMDMDEMGGSKLKDRMLHDGGPAVEIVRAFAKSTLLKEVES